MKFVRKYWHIGLAIFLALFLFERWQASYEWKEKYEAAEDSLTVVIQQRHNALREADRLRDEQAFNEGRIRELRTALEEVRRRRDEPIIIDENISDTELAGSLDSLLRRYRNRPAVRPDR